MQQIGFCDLKLDCIIGLHDHERSRKQPLIIDLIVDSEEFIDYTELADLAATLADVGKYLLLESLAEEVIRCIYQKWPSCRKVTLTLKKPAAIPGAAFAFVRLEK